MRKRINLLLLLAAMLLPMATRAQDSLIVAEGTATNSYVPLYGLYMDDYNRSQFVYPASMLEDLPSGSSITELTFFCGSSMPAEAWTSSMSVKMTEVDFTTFSSTTFVSTDDADVLFTGTLDATSGIMTVTLDESYVYNGGNLLVEFYSNTDGNWKSCSWLGIASNGSSLMGYSSSGLSSISPSQRNFLPKMAIEYTAGGDVSCYRVKNLTATDIDSASLTLHWIDTNNTGATYTVAYWAAGSTDTSYEYASDTFAVISGLNASTQYFFAVTPNCSDGSTANAASGNWRTTCGTTAIPYTEGFEDYATMAGPECWTTLSGMVYVRSSSSSSHSGGKYLDFRGFTSGDEIQSIALPPMGQPTNELQVRFWTRPESFTSSSCGSFSVGYMTDLNDDSTFVELANWAYNSFSAYDEKEVPMIGAPDDARIVLRHNGQSYNWYWYVDDLVVEPIPACPHPISVSAGNITPDGADITVAGIEDASYRIYWTDGTTTDSTDINGTSHTLTGLNSNTAYIVTAVTICDDGSITTSVSTTFRTACGDYVEIPYSDNFDDATNGELPNCWMALMSGNSGSGTFPSVYNYATNSLSSPNYFEFESTTGQTELVALPAMENISTLSLTFYASLMNHNFVLEVGVMEDTNFVTVDTVDLVAGSGSNWHGSYYPYTVYFSDYSGSGDRIALRVTASGSYTLMMDDFSVNEFTGCYPVTNLTASNIDSNEITLSWVDEMNGSGSYNIYYWTDGSDTLVATASDTTVTVTELSGNTLYHFGVAADCGSGESTMLLGDFRTACGSTGIPYVEDFESYQTTLPPLCWTQLNGNPRVQSSYPLSGSKHLYFSGAQPNTIALPPMAQPLSELQVRFWTRPESCTSSSCGGFAVGYMTDLNDDSTFVELASWQYNEWSSNTYEEKEVPMVGAPDNAIIVLRHNSNSSSWYWYVDDLVVEPIPTCARPVSVSAGNLSGTEADITVVGTDGANYRLWWTDGTTTDSTDITSDSYTITGLTPTTTYTVTAATICDDGTLTATASTSFMTTCLDGGCLVEIVMADSFGDGWNGHALNGLLNGESIFTATLSSGSAGTYTYPYCGGDDTLTLVFVSGSYPGEVSFTVNVGGTPMVSGGGNDYSQGDVVLTTVGCPTCSAPTALAVDSVNASEITVHWTAGGEETAWTIVINDSVIDNVTTNSYTISNLEQYTWYNIAVYAICGDEDTSFASQGISVRTAVACPWPTNLTANVTGDTVTLSWGNGDGSATDYQLVYGIAGFNPDTVNANNIIVVSGNTTYEINGLATGLYHAYVRSDCGTSTSIWTGPVSFGLGYTNIDQVDTLYTCGAIICDDGGPSGNYGSYRDDQVVIYPVDATHGLTISGHSRTEGSWDYLTVYEGVGTSGTILFQDNTSGVSSDLTVGPFDVFGPVTIAFHSDGSVQYDGFEIGVSCFDLTGCIHPWGVTVNSIFSDNATVAFNGSASGNYLLVITDNAGYVDTVSVIGDSTYNFTGLTPLTTYNVEVFSDCGAGEISESTSISFSTTAVPDVLPYSTGFETGDDLGWEILNGTETNKWYIDSAVNNGGSQSLYISNDGGATNSYSTSSSSNVYATKLLAFDSVGDYIVSYDWRCQGESHYYDWLRVFLAPASVSFTAGSAQPLGSSTYNASTAAVPEGWFDLNGHSTSPYTLSQSSSWNNVVETFSITNAGNYYLVFMWSNDGSGGTNPPAAVDNVQVARLSCPAPQNIVVDAVGTTSASFHWTPAGNESEWVVTVDGVSTVVTTPSASVSGLTEMTPYTITVRAICGVGDTSFQANATFATSFCDNASIATNYGSEDAVYSSGSSYSPIGYSLYDYSYVQTIIDSAKMAAISGEINALGFFPLDDNGTGDFSNMEVYLANVSESDLSAGFIHPDSAHTFVHVIASGDFNFTTADVNNWVYRMFDTNFVWDGHSNVLVAVNRLNGDYSSSNYFAAHTQSGNKMRYAYRDNTPYDIYSVTGGYNSTTVGDIQLISCVGGCSTPSVNVTNIEAQSATVTASGNGESFELKYGTDEANLSTTMTSTTGVFNLSGLQPETMYHYAVRQQCDSASLSNWNYGQFTTLDLGCLAPTGLNVVATGYTDVTLNWTVGNEETAWEVHVFSTTIDTVVPATATTTVVNGLAADLPYSAAVRALCGDGTIPGPWSDTVSFTTQACQAVTEVTVSATATTATVSWTGTSTSYRVIWGLQPFNPQDLAGEATVTTNSYTITGLDPEEDYAVVVYNNCAEGVSVPSATVNFSTVQGSGNIYTITATANNSAWGTVTGSGSYEEGSSVTLTATPNEGYTFVQWVDASQNVLSTDNPYVFNATANVTITAIFQGGEQGIDDVVTGTMSLYPNPASTSVTLGLEGFEGVVDVDVVDMNGRVVYKTNTTSTTVSFDVSELPQGAYFVRVTSGTQTAVRKLVVK